MVRPVEDIVAIVGAFFDSSIGAGGQVELAGEAAGIARVPEHLRDQDLSGRDGLSVLAAPGGPRVAAGQEGGPARGADGALDIGLFKGGTILYQGIDRGGVDEMVSQRSEGVIALLVGAEPEDVGLFRSWIHWRAGQVSLFQTAASLNRVSPPVFAGHPALACFPKNPP